MQPNDDSVKVKNGGRKDGGKGWKQLGYRRGVRLCQGKTGRTEGRKSNVVTAVRKISGYGFFYKHSFLFLKRHEQYCDIAKYLKRDGTESGETVGL